LKKELDMNIENSSHIILGATCVAIGLIGTYSFIKNAKHPIVRAFFIKASIVSWGFVVSCSLGIHFLAQPYADWVRVIFAVGLFTGLLYLVWKRRHILLEIAKSKRVALTHRWSQWPLPLEIWVER
jgi:uncharacterized membrane protein YfcA